jgi:hypothetical protein
VGGVGGGALGGVHGDRVAVDDVLACVVASEDDAGAVIEAFGGQPVVVLGQERDGEPLPSTRLRRRTLSTCSRCVTWAGSRCSRAT